MTSRAATGLNETLSRDLTHLESVWAEGMRQVFDHYRAIADARVALAAAMVETAVALQGLGERAADPARLLLGDLCLARSSRLLAETRDQRLQIGFARGVERVAAAAAGGAAPPSLRDELTDLIAGPQRKRI
jgi:hypothetical protein